MAEEYERADNPNTGMSYLTGKHRKAKVSKKEAIKRKMEGVKTAVGKVLRLHKEK